MTRKRSLQEKVKTVKEIQTRYSPSSNFYKELETVKAEYQTELDKEIAAKAKKKTVRKPKSK